MQKLAIALLALGSLVPPSVPAWANAYRKLLLEPPRLEKVASGTCQVMTLSLVNADGDGAVSEREKIVELTSSHSTTTFYSFFDPPCSQGVRTTAVAFVPGKSVVKFYFRDDLTRSTDPTTKGVPHLLTITASSKGVTSATAEAEIFSNDCAIACRDTTISNRVACTKKCPQAKDTQGTAAEKRKCWSDCFVAEESSLLNCQKRDMPFVAGDCGSSCQSFCDYFYGDCYGKCYFHKDSRNTSFGAKCVDECTTKRTKCRDKECGRSSETF